MRKKNPIPSWRRSRQTLRGPLPGFYLRKIWSREDRMVHALQKLGAYLSYNEIRLLNNFRYYEKFPEQEPSVNDAGAFEKWMANQARYRELTKRTRKYHKLKRAAKRRGYPFEEYVLWKASQLDA